MKAKKQRKITVAQINVVEKKLLVLQRKQARITKQATPLKVTLRKYIQQNMETLRRYVSEPKTKYSMLSWSVGQIKHGYFGDARFRHMLETIKELREANLLH